MSVLALAALLVAQAVGVAPSAVAFAPAAPESVEEPSEDEEPVDEAEPEAVGEDVAADRAELDELLKAEEAVIDPQLDAPRPHLPVERLGPANPLRAGVEGVFDPLTLPDAPLALEGDAGAVLRELAGIDLAALKASYDIPVELNDEVLAYVQFFQGSGRKWFEKWLVRSHRWIPFFRPILAEEGVPLDLVYLSMIESGFSPHAYSWAAASGPWQFISATGRRYGLRDDFWVDERRDPVKATRAAARYLKALHAEFGDWYLAWAGYNAGEGKVRRAIKMYGTRDFWELTRAGRYLRKETKHYVPKLIAAAIVAKHPERFGFTNITGEGPFEFDEVEVPDATDLAVVARSAGVEVERMQELNAPLRRWCTPPARQGQGYTVKVPAGTKEQFLAEFAKVAPSERLTFRHHRVRKGDTVGAIARSFGMPAEAILKMNRLSSPKKLRVGMDLIIPLPTQVAGKFPDTSSNWSEGRGRRSKATARRNTAKAERAVVRPAGPGQYVVKSGDTLWSIAQRFGVDVDELKRWNGLGRRAHRGLQVGQSLRVKAPPTRKAEATKGRG